MKRLSEIFFFIWVGFNLVGCDKVLTEMPSHNPVDPLPTDSVEIKSDTAYYTIGEAQTSYSSQIPKQINVVGYIVGDIVGTSINSAEFEYPFNSVSNIIIADDSLETNVSHCFPIALKVNTESREKLNLKNNFNLLHHRIVVRGTIETYFSQAGFRKIISWKFLSPNQQINTDTISSHVKDNANISINHQEEIITGGRVSKNNSR